MLAPDSAPPRQSDAQRLRQIFVSRSADSDETRPATKHGLIAVGSHVGLTTRQLDRLRDQGKIIELELDVPTLLDDNARDRHIDDVAAQAANVLRNNDSDSDIVIRTSRTLVTGDDATSSLVIARTVSAALVGTVREIVSQVRPAFVLAKGGITSSDTATEGLGDQASLVPRHNAARHHLALGARHRTCSGHPVHRVCGQRGRR